MYVNKDVKYMSNIILFISTRDVQHRLCEYYEKMCKEKQKYNYGALIILEIKHHNANYMYMNATVHLFPKAFLCTGTIFTCMPMGRHDHAHGHYISYNDNLRTQCLVFFLRDMILKYEWLKNFHMRMFQQVNSRIITYLM